MGRPRTGSVYGSSGKLYLKMTLVGRQRSFPFSRGMTTAEATLRQSLIADLAVQLEEAGHVRQAELFCEKAAQADVQTFSKLVELAKALLLGKMKPAPVQVATPHTREGLHGGMTVRDFSENFWTNNELARRFRRQIKVIDHTENIRRMKNHVFPVIFGGRTIGDTPLNEFTLEHGDFVKAQPSLPEGSVRHVAQCLHRLFKLAVYPAKLIERMPFPLGWLPLKNDPKERTFLFPEEEASVLTLAPKKLPLVWRMFFGFCAREGLRRENAVSLEWADLSLDLNDDNATVTLDVTKNARGGFWKLDPGTAEALRRWRQICPSQHLVFPAAALPRHWRVRAGLPLHVDKAGETLRQALRKAGQERAQLYTRNEHRLRLRAHDLRATFVTLSLALDRTEEWVMRRTGHLSSNTLAIYKRHAKTAKEVDLGWLLPMHEVIPELRSIGGAEGRRGLVLVGGTDVDS